jgi:hypothetical protein
MDDITGYLKEKRTVNVLLANIYSVLIFIFAAILLSIVYYLIWNEDDLFGKLKKSFKNLGFFSFLFMLIIGIILHELLHGIVFSIYAKKGYKSVKFGVLWKVLTPYCHCKEPLKVREFIIAALTPTVALGLVPSVISMFIGNIELLLFGILFFAAGAGDLMLVSSILREKESALIYDLPDEIGYDLYRKIEEVDE